MIDCDCAANAQAAAQRSSSSAIMRARILGAANLGRYSGANVRDLENGQHSDDVRHYIARLPDLRGEEIQDMGRLLSRARTEMASIRGFGLHGVTNAGKTHMAAAVVNSAAERLIPAAIIGIATLIWEIKSSYSARPEERIAAQDTFKRLRDLPLLVLDDIDKLSGTEHDVSMLYELVDHRYAHRLTTIVTANTSPKQFKAKLDSEMGAPIVRRIMDMAPVWWMVNRFAVSSDAGDASSGVVPFVPRGD
jgi:hypothetical protein